MNQSTPLSKANLAAVATPQQVRVLQIIYAALAMGIVTIAGVLLAASSTQTGNGSSTAPILSMVHGAMAFTSFFMGMFLFQVFVRKALALASPDRLMQSLTSAYVVRAALFEGPAMFGLVVLFIIGKQPLAEQPVYWANLASTVIFLLMLSMTFPTPDRILSLLRQNARTRP